MPGNESLSKIKVGKVGTDSQARQDVDQTQFSSSGLGRIHQGSLDSEPPNQLVELQENRQNRTQRWRVSKNKFFPEITSLYRAAEEE